MQGTPAALPLAEVLAALSLATDLAMGQPLEHGLRTCLLAEQLAARLGVDPETARDVYELALLQWVGCTAHAHELSGWFDDEIAAHERAATLDFGRPTDVILDVLRHAGRGRRLADRVRTIAGALVTGPSGVHELFASSCEVAGRLADQFRVGPGVRKGLEHGFARWDGRGWPTGAKGDAVSLPARVVAVAQDAAVSHRVGGRHAATEAVRRRSGGALDPGVADTFLAHADELLAATEQMSLWDAALAAEPGARRQLTGAEIDGALEAMADFADLKSPWTAGHSRRVAHLARGAARAAGLDPTTAAALGHAALVHDVGRVGVPNRVWDRPSPLTNAEWEQVRLHPYLTERILARSNSLRRLGDVASRHHERLDGSGYHRGATAGALSAEARVLAAADAFQSLLSDRPHRSGLDPGSARRFVEAEARAGRLDAGAVRSVLSAAGDEGSLPPSSRPAGLTEGEVQALRLLVRGLTLTGVAARLGISENAAGHRAEGIYAKIGVRSRAAAALFAAQHDLV